MKKWESGDEKIGKYLIYLMRENIAEEKIVGDFDLNNDKIV